MPKSFGRPCARVGRARSASNNAARATRASAARACRTVAKTLVVHARLPSSSPARSAAAPALAAPSSLSTTSPALLLSSSRVALSTLP
eukprot:4761356-Pyramimonas_sp.AAC.1